MIYAIIATAIFTLVFVLAIFYFIGKKVDKQKEAMYNQYFEQMKEVKMNKAKDES